MLRLYGSLVDHGASVVVPLLLADAPVVVWWPGEAPEVPAEDPIGMLGERRITDAASAKRPMAQLAKRRDSYRPGDTDLSWTRITRWRGLLASTLDQPPHDKVTGATVAGAADSPSADLLAGWLALALKVPVKRVKSPAKSGPGLHSVVLNRRCGDISLIRPQTITAELKVANQPERHVALPRRGLRDCLSEELRRLDADDVYAEVLTKGMALVAKQAAAADTKAPAAKAPATKAATRGQARHRRTKATAVKAPATQAAGRRSAPATQDRGRCRRRSTTRRPSPMTARRPAVPGSDTGAAAVDRTPRSQWGGQAGPQTPRVGRDGNACASGGVPPPSAAGDVESVMSQPEVVIHRHPRPAGRGHRRPADHQAGRHPVDRPDPGDRADRRRGRHKMLVPSERLVRAGRGRLGRVEIFWGDERFVPAADPDRNEKQAREALLDHVPVDPARVHAMAASDGEFGDDVDAAAAAYADIVDGRDGSRSGHAGDGRRGPRRVDLPGVAGGLRHPVGGRRSGTARNRRRPGSR